jgi:hypothetical protein
MHEFPALALLTVSELQFQLLPSLSATELQKYKLNVITSGKIVN